MSISECIEQVKTEVCKDYCKYPNMEPPEGKDENWLFEEEESPCLTCPLNQL